MLITENSETMCDSVCIKERNNYIGDNGSWFGHVKQVEEIANTCTMTIGI